MTGDVIRNAEVDADIAYSVASVYALEGMNDEAFDWLARAIALGNENQPCFEHDPNWSALKNTARFQELMSRITAQHSADGIKAQAASQTGVENKSADV